MKIKYLSHIQQLCCFLVILFATEQARAQSHYFRHYQVENGLSNNAVICSYQDKKGFLWFGTRDGLNRFDGISFKIFRNDPNNANSIGNNSILRLREDNNDNIWVGTERGLYVYDPVRERFDIVHGTEKEAIRGIEVDGDGKLWFIVGFDLYQYGPQTDSLHPIGAKKASDVSAICVTANGQLWVSTASGWLKKYNSGSRSFTSYNLFDKSLPPRSTWIEKIFDTEQGSILVGTSNQGVKIFDISSGTYKDLLTYNPDQTEIYARDFIRQGKDEYWVATESGVFILQLRTGAFSHIRKQYNDNFSLSDNAIYNFCKDKEGGVWIGTYFGGVNYYSRQYTPFEKFFPKMNVNAIAGNAVREMRPDALGNLWIGTEDAGLSKLNLPSGIFTNYKPERERSSISNTNIHGLLVTGDTLWVGTFKRGLDLMDVKSGRILGHYDASEMPNTFKTNFIYCMIRSQTGKVVIGTDKGLYEYNKAHNNFLLIPEVPGHIFYTALFEDSRGTIWAGTNRDGLFYFNPVSGKSGRLPYEHPGLITQGNNRINSIFEDNGHALWLTTENGLYRLDKQGSRRFTTQNGFPSNVMYAMLEDAKQNLWISTTKGLACFRPASGKVTVYTKANGLLSDQFNYNSAYKNAEGRMYFGSVKGMVSFNPAAFITNNFISPVYLTAFEVQNQDPAMEKNNPPLEKSITYTNKITLDYNQSSFNIDFAALSYTVPEMTEYAYMMEGIDRNWNYLKTYRRVYFTELAPGRYIFNVKAANSSGIWNTQLRRLEIVIQPPFWASTSAYLLYAMLVLAAIYVVIRHNHKKSEAKHHRKIELLEIKKEKEIYEAKIDFFTNVAHEIRTPLTLIKGPLETVMKRIHNQPDIRNYLRIMEKNTNRLLDLTTEILDFRKTETKRFILTLEHADICELIAENYISFKPVAEQKNLAINLELPAAAIAADVDVEAFNKIVTNLLNNAVKYAKSRVLVSLLPRQPEDKFLSIVVKNDGFLIPADMKDKIFEAFFRIRDTDRQQGSGIGLSIARSLAELHRGLLELAEPENDLNVFILKLPVEPLKIKVININRNQSAFT